MRQHFFRKKLINFKNVALKFFIQYQVKVQFVSDIQFDLHTIEMNSEFCLQKHNCRYPVYFVWKTYCKRFFILNILCII